MYTTHNERKQKMRLISNCETEVKFVRLYYGKE